jgi:superfamily II DNA/RNA helicase
MHLRSLGHCRLWDRPLQARRQAACTNGLPQPAHRRLSPPPVDPLSCAQALVFCNDTASALWTVEWLTAAGVPAAHLSARVPQSARMIVMQRLRRFELRVAVASDVLARGIDLPAVNVVIHLDVSHDAATYMHRIGRAGRFGTKGVSISLLFPEELQRVQAFLSDLHGGALFLCFN